MKIVLIDNYDSFTYNLVHLIKKITKRTPYVFKNDEIGLDEIADYDLIFLSPGPGTPNEAGILKDIVKHFAGVKPIFGVCLGLQAIVEVFGGKIINLNTVFHGIGTTMNILKKNTVIFHNISQGFTGARYHSWVASVNSFPEELEITCVDEDGEIMAIKHKNYPISAVQFHPESILTDVGEKIVSNFINHYSV